MRPAHVALLTLMSALNLVQLTHADDWAQWRGPDRNEISKEKGLLKTWPKEGPKQVWLFKEAGIGYSGPAIVGNRLYTMGARDKTEFLIAIDTANGKEL